MPLIKEGGTSCNYYRSFFRRKHELIEKNEEMNYKKDLAFIVKSGTIVVRFWLSRILYLPIGRPAFSQA
jgi:hypothetical protein